jgi:hypothetical protein
MRKCPLHKLTSSSDFIPFAWKMTYSMQLTQDLEEDRIDFVRSSLWDFANALSTICMLEDEVSKRNHHSLHVLLVILSWIKLTIASSILTQLQ